MTKLLGRNNLNKLETRGVGSIADSGGGDPAPTLGENPDSDSGGADSDPGTVDSDPGRSSTKTGSGSYRQKKI